MVSPTHKLHLIQRTLSITKPIYVPKSTHSNTSNHEMLILAILLLNLSRASTLNVNFAKHSHKCLHTIIQNEYKFKDHIAILGDKSDIFVPPDIPVTISDFEHYAEAKNFVVFIGKSKILTNLAKFDKKARYIIVTKDAMEVLKVVQEEGISRVLIVDTDNTYYRHNPQICDSPPLVVVGYVTTPPFVINLQRPHNPGVLVSMMRTLKDLTHIDIVYQNSTMFHNELLNNGSLYKLGWALENGEIDIAIGHLMMNDTLTTPFDFGPLLLQDYITFIVPKPKKLKSYKKLFIVFKMDIWVRVFVGIWVMVVIFYIFGLIESFEKTTLFETVFDVFHVCIGGAVTHLPTWISFRILLIFFFLFSLSMDSIYLGNLSQIFGFSSYDSLVDNVQRIVQTHLKFVVSWRMERLCLLTYVTRSGRLRHELLHIKNFTETYLLNNTAVAKENGTIVFSSFLDLYPSEAANLASFQPKTDYLTLFDTFYFNKNTLFNEALAFWSQEMVEKGLVLKWFNDIRVSNVRTSILPEDEAKVVILKVAHFEESFRVLIGGYVLGVVALLLEFVFLKLERVGLVRWVKEGVVFLVLLLKPPELKKGQRENASKL